MNPLPASEPLMLCARVPAYGDPAWHGPLRHPESADDFGSIANLQHIARTLAHGGFELLLVDPPVHASAPGAIDPCQAAIVLALAAPALRIGLRHAPAGRAAVTSPQALLGAQWAGVSPVNPSCSVSVLVGANRWLAEDQLEFLMQRFPAPKATTARQSRSDEVDPDPMPAIIVGSPAEVVDELERRLARSATRRAEATAPIGRPIVELVPLHIPGSYEAFVRMVVPELRRRGLIGEDADPWRRIT